jgi:hypothetical protein
MASILWQIRGEQVAGCNCAWGCPCQFNALPTHGRCEGFATFRIAEGRFGEVQLDGVRFAVAFSFPGAVHEGNGTFHVIVDARATAEQRDAIIAVTSGAHGGTLFEIFATVAPNRPRPLAAAIDIEADRERRTAKLSLPGMVEYRAEPIKNPVTGEEHRAQIRLPNGFEYREAEMGNTTWLKVAVGAIAFEHRNSYAQFNAFDWSNQPA